MSEITKESVDRLARACEVVARQWRSGSPPGHDAVIELHRAFKKTTPELLRPDWDAEETRAPHPSHAAVEAMAQALEEWPAFCAEAESHINGVITFAAVHGVTYDGPNWTDILNQTKAALAAYRATQTKDVRP